MYKVLIVDDEKEIRDGLAAWSWEAIGLQIAGCCSHGLEALQFITEHPVDIVMTDIRMPFMNGIELMQILNRQYPFIKVIILSGHSDFDYAQKAIQRGAADYLLKPVQFPTLSKSFEMLVRKLDKQKQSKYRILVLRRKEELLTKVLRDDFLSRLFQTAMSPDDIEQASSEGEVMLDSDCFTVAVFRLDRLSLHKQSISEREAKLLAFSLDNILNDLWDSGKRGYHLVNKSAAEFYLLSKKHDPQEEFTALLPQLIKLTGLFKSTFSAAIGQTVRRPCEMHHSARSAEFALHRNKEGSSVSFYSDEDFPMEKKEPVPPDSGNSPVFETEREQNSVILVHAKQYILDHYHRSITLQEVADHVYISQGHLSALFKETGETYLRFLTSVRMKKATELLRDPSIKVYEVVEKVGYTDPAYFSEVFKKYMGKTPNEFRGKSRQMREES